MIFCLDISMLWPICFFFLPNCNMYTKRYRVEIMRSENVRSVATSCFYSHNIKLSGRRVKLINNTKGEYRVNLLAPLVPTLAVWQRQCLTLSRCNPGKGPQQDDSEREKGGSAGISWCSDTIGKGIVCGRKLYFPKQIPSLTGRQSGFIPSQVQTVCILS